MRVSEIEVGGYYFDGGHGVRCVIQAAGSTCRYRVLASRKGTESVFKDGEWINREVRGTEVDCMLQTMASWAKCRLDSVAAELVAAGVAASRIKLAPGERHLMDVLRGEGGPWTETTEYSVEPAEKRAVTGLVKKGLLAANADKSGVTLTAAGVALFNFEVNF